MHRAGGIINGITPLDFKVFKRPSEKETEIGSLVTQFNGQSSGRAAAPLHALDTYSQLQNKAF